jgi:glycosyltransferase involved in cell wall biosynthesis
VLHQTFVLSEVIALRRLGVPIKLYSLKRPSTRTQQPEGAALVHEVTYLPRISAALIGANLRVLVRSPKRYIRAFVRLVRHWWQDRHVRSLWHDKSAPRDPAERIMRFRERVLGFIHTNRVVYLLRSCPLVFIAVYLGEQLRKEGISRIHAHWASYPTTVALVIRWIFGIPFSFSAHAYDIYLCPQWLPVKVRGAEFVATCARFNAAYLEQLAGPAAHDRIRVNYHGVDLTRFTPQRRQAVDAVPRLVTCGRLQMYKGHHILLRAFAKLTQPVRCTVIGEGPQHANLEQLARELGIADRVEFTGPLPQEEVARHCGQATLFVLASIVVTSYAKRDVIPNVLAEAMAMQVPVVASDISGIGELVRDGSSGRLVPPGDPDALARVLDELLRDEPQRRRLALGGYQKVVTEFDRSINIRALARLLVGEPAGTMTPPGQSTAQDSRHAAPSSVA